jgi:hypothetical protein
LTVTRRIAAMHENARDAWAAPQREVRLATTPCHFDIWSAASHAMWRRVAI